MASDALEAAGIQSTLLSGLNDSVSVTPYAHGFLVSLPLYFYDNDRVKLFVEPFESGVKVGDRGTTAMRLMMADLNLEAKRVEESLRQSSGPHLFAFGSDSGEISAFGRRSELAELVFAVGSAVLRVDQLRWLASDRRPVEFRDRVVDELVHVVGVKERVTPHASLALKSGRNKQVTASVLPRIAPQVDLAPLYVQALSGRDSDARESSVARCFHLFSLARASKDRLVAVASGTRKDWPNYLISEITGVSTLAFFDERGSVAETVQRKLAQTA